ncbi:MAG: hypothetical protein H6721_09890 [Sandaracinus sp.]|nr:hypothetical protein [Sandaracinus sp.]MCB9616043.1 hypothetical protein [Sandaracinus sp.]MCB9632426.1 hypothetical protein [Sandaracinus sp.]
MRSFSRALVLFSFLLVACGDDDRPAARVDGGGGGVDGGVPRDASFVDAPPTTCGAPIDLVFVLDVSTSMDDEIDAVAAGTERIWEAATALTPDVQLGLVVFVDSVVPVNGCGAFASYSALSSELRSRWLPFTESNEQPPSGGNNSDCAENSLDALYAAATQCPWREGATRMVVHVTDDTFAEPPTSLSGVTVQRSYLETLSALTAREIRVGAFATPSPGNECALGPTPLAGQGFHESYGAQTAIPVATGGRAWNLRDVRGGTLDMATAISELIEDEYCTLY